MSAQSTLGTAVITGASTGIGAIYADRLAKRGYDVLLVARDAARLATLATRLRAEAGVQAQVLRADLTEPADLRTLEKQLASDPAITLLVNNAGLGLGGGFPAADPDRLENLIALNITALTRLTHAAAIAFKARGKGDIINIGSVVALWPELQMSVYSATKSYVLHLVQALDLELAGTGVRLQAVLPGATRTELWARSGLAIEDFDPALIMEAHDLVDAALAGFDRGELVTIPSLPDPADWDALEAARLRLLPNLSHNHPAPRYGVRVAEPA